MTAPFRIVDEHRAVLLTATDVVGLFVATAAPGPARIKLLGVEFVAPRARRYSEVSLQIVNADGVPIGDDFLGELELNLARLEEHTAVEAVLARGALDDGEHVPAIWRRRASAMPLTAGEWRLQPAEWHRSWIHVAQRAWFHEHRDAGRAAELQGQPAVLDGRGLDNRDGFWCALGEAVNGVGGYFGSSLGGLEDCLRSSSTDEFPFTLEWRDIEDSRTALGGTFVQMVCDVFADYRVEVAEA